MKPFVYGAAPGVITLCTVPCRMAVIAAGCHALGVPIAAGVLYPVFGILLSPVIAALAMSLSSVSVVGNALRLRTLRL